MRWTALVERIEEKSACRMLLEKRKQKRPFWNIGVEGINTKVDFMFFIPCIFPKLIHQPTYALHKIQYKTSIKLLHVSAPGCHRQGFI
jgi:hypothetical protein